MSRAVRVLSIDGGGVRGIIPALVLAEMERRTGMAVGRMFDFVAGTSTGGLLALGLSMPDEAGEPALRTARVIEMYEKAGQSIFVRTSHNPVHPLLHERYPSDHIERTLDAYFGDTPLSAAATEVMVTSYDLLSRDVVLMSSAAARDDSSLDLPMRVAARATSAAPTYFHPVPVRLGTPSRDRLLIDGGVFANNPAMCAYTEVQRRRPGAEVAMVSLGTGDPVRPLPQHEVRDWGLAHWARAILHVVLDGASEVVHLQLRELLDRRRYIRLQVDLRQANDHLDDATTGNIELLRAEAERLIAERDGEIDAACALVAG